MEYFDVQTELVDHLANDIEQIWSETPSVTFEEARAVSFKKFGVFGFMEVVEERQKSLNKKYWSLVWHIFKQFFTIPHIILTITIGFAFFFVFKYLQSDGLFAFLFMLVFGFLIVRLFYLQKLRKKRYFLSQKKWLLEEYIFNLGNFAVLINLIFQLCFQLRFFKFSVDFINPTIVFLVQSVFFTVLGLLIYSITYLLPSKVEEILSAQYPEYKLV